MLKAVIFDLDDTLYDESEYVRQAFGNTAAYLAERLDIPEKKDEYYERMLELLAENGRGKIFDLICGEIKTDITAGELVRVYRSTRPDLRLYPDAEQLLNILADRRIKTGLITDGCGQVQHEKINALGLEERLDCVIATDDFGLPKPDPEGYERCLGFLGCAAAEAAYVGDNPGKDFIGAKALGMGTFRIVRERGMHMGDVVPPRQEADHRIRVLTELTGFL